MEGVALLLDIVSHMVNVSARERRALVEPDPEGDRHIEDQSTLPVSSTI